MNAHAIARPHGVPLTRGFVVDDRQESASCGPVPSIPIPIPSVNRFNGPIRRSGSTPDPLGGRPVDPSTLEKLRRRRGGGQALPESLAAPVSGQLGVALSHVRVHADRQAQEITRSLDATAFTHGSDIYFGPGEYNPGSPIGQAVIVHELAHVAQPGKIPTGSTPIIGRADDPAEAEADAVAHSVLERLRSGNDSAAPTGSPSSYPLQTAEPGQLGAIRRRAPEQRRPWIRRMRSAEEELQQGTTPEPKGSAQQVVLEDIVVDIASRDADVVEKGSDELVSILRPVLTAYLAAVQYNSLEDAAAYARHLKSGRTSRPGTTPQEAFSTFAPDSTGPIKSVLGAQCVGQALDFAEYVRSKTGLSAYATAAQFAGRKQYGHAAALMKFRNPKVTDDAGFILLDPGFNADEPLVITPAVSAKLRKFVYRWNPETQKIENVKEDGQVAVTFETTKLMNPDQSVSRNALISYKTFTVVTRGLKTNIVLQVDLANDEFSLRRGSKAMKCKLSEMEQITKMITNEISEALGYGKEGSAHLLESVRTVIEARDDIVNLQKSTVIVKENGK